MSTKNNPGPYDCYAHAEPSEPLFVLLGRDPMAGALVREWASWRELTGEDPAKIAEARATADAMDRWAKSLGLEDRLETVAILRLGGDNRRLDYLALRFARDAIAALPDWQGDEHLRIAMERVQERMDQYTERK